MRRALVNDVVHSFCFSCRAKLTEEKGSAYYWPYVMLGNPGRLPPVPRDKVFTTSTLVPFVAYAFARLDYAGEMLEAALKISDYLRKFTDQEIEYAVHLMEKYYDYRISTGKAIKPNSQPELPGNKQQEIQHVAEVSQRNDLLDDRQSSSVPKEISTNKSASCWGW